MTSSRAAGTRTHVLVVDDDRAVLSTVRDALLSEGHSVNIAACGEEALSAMERQRPDLILLDVNMPQVDGWEVLARLRTASGHQTPVVVMTAGRTARDRALANGAQGYLAKPLELYDLYNAIETHADVPAAEVYESVR